MDLFLTIVLPPSPQRDKQIISGLSLFLWFTPAGNGSPTKPFFGMCSVNVSLNAHCVPDNESALVQSALYHKFSGECEGAACFIVIGNTLYAGGAFD